MMIDNDQRRNEIKKLKHQDRIRVGFEVVFDLKWESKNILYILFFSKKKTNDIQYSYTHLK